MTDETNKNNIEGLFDINNKNLNKAIRKVKIKSIMKITFISLIVVLVLAITSTLFGSYYTDKERSKIDIEKLIKENIGAPDKFRGKSMRYQSSFGGKVIYTTYKVIEGKVVYTGFDEYSYGIIKSGNKVGTEWPSILGNAYTENDLKNTIYNEVGQREMEFFYPFVKYSKYKSDFKLLDEIESNKYIEMALSFDKAYDIDQIKNLFPTTTHITWYWIDDLSAAEKKERLAYAINYKENRICNETNSYGVKSINSSGEYLKDPFGLFTAIISNEYKENSKNGEIKRLYNNLKGKDGKLTPRDLKIEGVVVTGTPETLKLLQNLPFIKASSIGVITDKY